MYAPGLPDKKVKTRFPNMKDKYLPYSIQQHDADRAGRHYDVRIAMDGTAISWATRKGIPSTGEKVLWVRQPDHTIDYMDFSGVIEDGYGKGKVKVVERGELHVIYAEPGKIKFNLYKGASTVTIMMVSTGGGNWLCMNVTPTRTTRPQIPKKKIKALSVAPMATNIEDKSEILTPKVDGAATVFLLKKDKGVEAFSYRRSKRGPELINRTYKYPQLYNTKVPKELDRTVLWGESFVSDSSGKALPHRMTGGMLNMNVRKAMNKAKENDWKFDNIIYNIHQFKGKDVHQLPYNEKLRLMKDITAKIPALKLPPLAITEKEKRVLVDAIKNKRYPQTTEGWVGWNLNRSKPTKYKLKEDMELYVQDFEEGKGKNKGRLGKFVATPDRSGKGVPTRVSGRLSNAQRSDIWENKERYRGLPITVEYQSKLPSGKLRMPIFKRFRTEW